MRETRFSFQLISLKVYSVTLRLKGNIYMALDTKTTLPFEKNLWRVCIELWVVTAVPSPVSLVTGRLHVGQNGLRWPEYTKAPETIWTVSSRAGELKCLYEKKFSRLTGLPYLPKRDNSPSRVLSRIPKTMFLLLITISPKKFLLIHGDLFSILSHLCVLCTNPHQEKKNLIISH